jgi:AAA+ superfamily predicted ATPase
LPARSMAARMGDPALIRAAEDDARPAAVPHALLPALRRLDAAIEPLIRAAQAAGGIAAASLRGMYVSAEEAARLLARAPGAPVFDGGLRNKAVLAGPAAATAPFDLLQQFFALSDFDLDAVVIALAPELDLRYERLYGFLQDDVTRRGPTVDLVLNLRTSSAQEKMAGLARFAPDAPLVRNAVVQLVADPQHLHPPLLAHYLKVDPQIVALLRGHDGLDPRLSAFARLVEPSARLDRLQLEADAKRGLRALAQEAQRAGRPLKLYFRGPDGTGQSAAAEALAGELGLKFLHADLRRTNEAAAEFEAACKLLIREAWLKDAMLYLDGIDVLRGEPRAACLRQFLVGLSEHPGVAVLAGEQAWPPPGCDLTNLVCVTFGMPDFAARQECWKDNLAKFGAAPSPCEIDALAGRFRLTPAQIAGAAASGRGRALWRAATAGKREAGLSAPAPTLADLFAGARAQSGRELEKLARKIEPKQSWNDIVLPPDQTTQLHEICDQARLRQVVYGAWGFDRKLSAGKGLNVLFAGPPGTGKTMAAEVMASELALDLYKIDLSQIVSKYIGETEKNLDRIFAAAESANAILFFDEADALFGKRSEVKDSHDRYANIEIGYLLQKMEEYEGMAMLATNLRQNIDDAFLRRLQSIVDFPFPDENHRRRIWNVVFPPEAPLGSDVDFAALARDVRLAGGSIKNIAVSAAFHAAADGKSIEMKHLIRAARREHQKLGRIWASTRPAAPSDC